MFKKNCLIVLIIVFSLIFGIIKVSLDSQEFKVVFLDVGQGDASLLKLPGNKIILIDGGPNNIVIKRLGENLPFYQRSIDLIIISHWHDDHIIGLIEVIARYKVKTLIYIDDADKNNLTAYLLVEAQRRGVKLFPLKSSATLNYKENCQLNLLNPLSLAVKENGNNSIVAKLLCRNLSFLFSGDNELEVEEMLLQTTYNLRAQIFKASHHGSKTSNSLEFLQAVSPKLIVIPVGADNRFNHPATTTLETINSLGIKIKRTDKDSSIIIKGD